MKMARTLLCYILLLSLAEMVIPKAMDFEKQNKAESIMQNGKNTILFLRFLIFSTNELLFTVFHAKFKCRVGPRGCILEN